MKEVKELLLAFAGLLVAFLIIFNIYKFKNQIAPTIIPSADLVQLNRIANTLDVIASHVIEIKIINKERGEVRTIQLYPNLEHKESNQCEGNLIGSFQLIPEVIPTPDKCGGS